MKISHVATRQDWLAARLDLLAKEKAVSRDMAALAEQRRALPAVPVDTEYAFEGSDGTVRLIDLTYGVGADVMLSTYRFLDLSPLGRQRYMNEWPRHDMYGASEHHAHQH
jgi:predicted dithiol-disulfide oxidoreductase (DUF899 family)